MENILFKHKCQKNFQYRDEKFTPVKGFGNTNLRWNKERKVSPTKEIKENQSMTKMGTQNILYFSLKSLMIKTFFQKADARKKHAYLGVNIFFPVSHINSFMHTHQEDNPKTEKRE